MAVASSGPASLGSTSTISTHQSEHLAITEQTLYLAPPADYGCPPSFTYPLDIISNYSSWLRQSGVDQFLRRETPASSGCGSSLRWHPLTRTCYCSMDAIRSSHYGYPDTRLAAASSPLLTLHNCYIVRIITWDLTSSPWSCGTLLRPSAHLLLMPPMPFDSESWQFCNWLCVTHLCFWRFITHVRANVLLCNPLLLCTTSRGKVQPDNTCAILKKEKVEFHQSLCSTLFTLNVFLIKLLMTLQNYL